MKTSKFHLAFGLALACAALIFSPGVRAQAQTVTNVVNFNGENGHLPQGQTIIQATNGRFYGTTVAGGAYGKGNVYELTPGGKASNFYSFCSLANCADGEYPSTSPILGSDGNLYGVTYSGGNDTGATSGSGTVYKLTLSGKLTTLYAFCPTTPCVDGQYPNGIIQASDGNLYGTTLNGGNDYNGSGAGTIFEITASGEFKSLHVFCSLAKCDDGGYPDFPPIEGMDGQLYGIAASGGTDGGGGVFYELTSSGSYQPLVEFCAIFSGNCPTGTEPTTVVQDASGNFYGTTRYGGSKSYGTIFKVTPQNVYSVLQDFDFAQANPFEGLTLANDGNLYLSTPGVVTNYDAGTILEVTPEAVAKQIYAFGNCVPGSYGGTVYDSWSPLFQATNGKLYGSTLYGCAPRDEGEYGTIFAVSNNLSPLVETVPVRGSAGTRVIILGNHLTGSRSVEFNGVKAAFTVESDSYIKATVPAGATTGLVSVVTPSGTLNSNPQFVVTK